jgi:hypothetical protein
MELREVNQENV